LTAARVFADFGFGGKKKKRYVRNGWGVPRANLLWTWGTGRICTLDRAQAIARQPFTSMLAALGRAEERGSREGELSGRDRQTEGGRSCLEERSWPRGASRAGGAASSGPAREPVDRCQTAWFAYNQKSAEGRSWPRAGAEVQGWRIEKGNGGEPIRKGAGTCCDRRGPREVGPGRKG